MLRVIYSLFFTFDSVIAGVPLHIGNRLTVHRLNHPQLALTSPLQQDNSEKPRGCFVARMCWLPSLFDAQAQVMTGDDAERKIRRNIEWFAKIRHESRFPNHHNHRTPSVLATAVPWRKQTHTQHHNPKAM